MDDGRRRHLRVSHHLLLHHLLLLYLVTVSRSWRLAAASVDALGLLLLDWLLALTARATRSVQLPLVDGIQLLRRALQLCRRRRGDRLRHGLHRLELLHVELLAAGDVRELARDRGLHGAASKRRDVRLPQALVLARGSCHLGRWRHGGLLLPRRRGGHEVRRQRSERRPSGGLGLREVELLDDGVVVLARRADAHC